MLTESELRIGNLVRIVKDTAFGHHIGDTVIVESISHEGINAIPDIQPSGIRLDEIDGIDITEEILLGFGFTIVHSMCGRDCNKVFPGGVMRGAFHSTTYISYDFKRDGYYMKINHVHRLQNLFFELTDTDL